MIAELPRFLLVEPQFVLRRTIASVAQQLGAVHFEECSGIDRARPLMLASPFDGLVLDLQEGTPVLGLLQALRAGEFATAPDAPVIMLAADLGADDARRLEALGVSQVLRKPVKIAELLSRIELTLAR